MKTAWARPTLRVFVLTEPKKTIEEIAALDGRYDVRALQFVYEGLGRTVERFRAEYEGSFEPHHISGAQLAGGLGDFAMDRWGRLARMVLGRWGITTTRDFGEIVYLMIEYGWMSAQDSDRVEDFDGVFDFEQNFEKGFRFNSV